MSKNTTKIIGFGAIALATIITVVALNITHTGNGSDKIEGTITTDNGDLKINWGRYPTYDIELADTYTITSSGTYHLAGTITDGAVIVNADAEAKVRIILDNVTIKNTSGPAIACYNADDLVIELIGENSLSDGDSYFADYDEDVTGAIYSKSDLTFQGDGTLNLTASYQDGIVAKDDLKFNSGTYIIDAVDDGIRGKDSVYIVDGNFTIRASGDTIKSTNETTSGKGFVLIEKGTFALNSGAKGIKAINSILIYSGDFNITSIDDTIHSNNYVGIMDGNFTLNSNDDGMHADKELIIDGGNIKIAKSYEGIEAQAITINGGDISVTSSDDGLNAGGGADSSATNRQGAGAFDVDTSCILAINGGNLYVNAGGDGVDSNGYLYFNGGTVIVDGPTNNGNGALDAGAGIVQNGGTVIAVGASGMAETLGSSSSVYNVSIYFTSTNAAGTTVTIKNSAGEAIISHTSAKTFNHMSVGTPNFKQGETYTVYINGNEYQSFTVSSTTTTVGNSNGNRSGGMMQRR
ncbi:carbohydrate-binding domain-containing protein [Candidatus Saccharibacteria bacterium]|nr:carbohydrate-binding domain-containing protein [Candidatus Saccharibacteria bacterium]